MKEKQNQYYYRAVPGSRELATSKSGNDAVLNELEKGNPKNGPAPLFQYKDKWLGGSLFEGGVTVPASVFDLLGPVLGPVEQAVYIQMFRLSYGKEKNWCRVGKRELGQRTGLSDRRLNASLDGLVTKGVIGPLHRNTKGTLYRIYLPAEILENKDEPGIIKGEKIKIDAPDKTALEKPVPPKKKTAKKTNVKKRERPLESPLNEERFADVSGRGPKGPGLSEMAGWFFKKHDIKADKIIIQDAMTSITELLEDGFTRDEIKKAIEWTVENVPEEKDLSRLQYHISSALDD